MVSYDGDIHPGSHPRIQRVQLIERSSSSNIVGRCLFRLQKRTTIADKKGLERIDQISHVPEKVGHPWTLFLIYLMITGQPAPLLNPSGKA
jgi:hypothetical protein